MNILFLDVDGVLNDEKSKSNCNGLIGIDDSKVKILKEIVDKTNSKIVLTSTWKRGWDENIDNCDLYGRYLTKKLKKQKLNILDKTVETGSYRGYEIHNWLTKHQVDNWIVIDDEIFCDYDDEIINHLIKTDFYNGGLKQKHIQKALALIKGD